jgi:biotin-(acetyl-CoA carboxylase) ligase
VVGDRKVAGILAEADDSVVVIGLGVNLWWPEPIAGAGALHAADPGPEVGAFLAVGWAGALLERMERSPDDWGRVEYIAKSSTVGEMVTWEPGGAGRAIGIADNGGLVVDTGSGAVLLDSGSVRTIRVVGPR